MRRRHGVARGSSIAEALVAAALAGIGLAGLASVAGLATRSLRLARDTGTALALATERLETLRAGPRAADSDRTVAPDGTEFTRRWELGGGRGNPVRLSVDVGWEARTLSLATEALP